MDMNLIVVCVKTFLGLGRLELEQCPLNRHIRRLVAEISPYKCRELAIHLGVTVNSWENLEYQFQHQNPDDIKFMALYGWKEAHKSASFSDLSKALTDCDISDHLLCKVRLVLWYYNLLIFNLFCKKL